MNITPKDVYLCFRRGALDGFAGKPVNKNCSEHDNKRLRSAYNAGYRTGTSHARQATEVAESLSGYKPSPKEIISR